MKRILILQIVWLAKTCCAQLTLSESEFVRIIQQFHPVVKQAGINVSIAKAQRTAARGNFDPVLSMSNRKKVFAGDSYYDQTTTQLMIPTWYGIDFYAGTETLAGNKTDPESTKGNMSFAGINVPIMQNLLYDKRRAAIQKADLMIGYSIAQQQQEINDLLHDALHNYWEWWQHYQSYLLADSLLKNAQTRFSMIRTAVNLGDRAAIDTVEAFTQIQTLELEKAEAIMNCMKSRIALSAFLWDQNTKAYDLPDNVIPSEPGSSTIPRLDSLIILADAHPALQQYEYKLPALQIERKLKFQLLLPDIDLKYQQLGQNYDFRKTINSPWFQNNYRFGINLYVPLRLSEARGEYKQAKLRIEEAVLQQRDKRVQIQNKLKQYFTEWNQTSVQIQQQLNLIKNYTALQKAEETRFFNGESSLFVVNAREMKTLEAKQKLITLYSKNKKALTDVRWSAAIL